jgi:hypothetical protein
VLQQFYVQAALKCNMNYQLRYSVCENKELRLRLYVLKDFDTSRITYEYTKAILYRSYQRNDYYLVCNVRKKVFRLNQFVRK